MEIRRYLNGKPISQAELSTLSLRTSALVGAVKEVRRRAEWEETPWVDGASITTSQAATMTARSAGTAEAASSALSAPSKPMSVHE